jgi:hypothetical protein
MLWGLRLGLRLFFYWDQSKVNQAVLGGFLIVQYGKLLFDCLFYLHCAGWLKHCDSYIILIQAQ